MDPITLRIQTDLLSEIESEAEELGYSSRAEYIRHLLQNREYARNALSSTDSVSSVDPNASHANIDRIDTLEADLDEVVARVERIEEMIEGGASSPESPEVEQTETPSESETIDEPDATEPTTETEITELKAWLDQQGPQNETPREIIVEAAQILRTDGPLAKGVLKERLYKASPDAYKSEDTLWGSTIERVYEEAPGFTKPKYGQYGFA